MNFKSCDQSCQSVCQNTQQPMYNPYSSTMQPVTYQPQYQNNQCNECQSACNQQCQQQNFPSCDSQCNAQCSGIFCSKQKTISSCSRMQSLCHYCFLLPAILSARMPGLFWINSCIVVVVAKLHSDSTSPSLSANCSTHHLCARKSAVPQLSAHV